MKITAIRNHRLYKIFMAGLILLLFSIAFMISYRNRERSTINKQTSPRIKDVVAQKLNKEANKLTSDDFIKIESLFLNNLELYDLKPLKKLTNIKELELKYIKKSCRETPSLVTNFRSIFGLSNSKKEILFDIKPLGCLKNLEKLTIEGVYIDSYKPLAELKNLQYLIIRTGDNVIDLSLLQNLTNLKVLNLSDTNIKNINLLSSFINLENLNLSDTDINDISPIAELYNLKELDLTQTYISDISPLEKLTNLQTIYLNDTFIRDIGSLAKIENLKKVELENTFVSNIMVLKGLKNLQEINVIFTPVSDFEFNELKKVLPNFNNEFSDNFTIRSDTDMSSEEKIKIIAASILYDPNMPTDLIKFNKDSNMLKEEDYINIINLDLYFPDINDISLVSKFPNIQSLYLSETHVSDLKPLRNLIKLEELHLARLPLGDISELSNLTSLRFLDISFLPVSDLKPLENLVNLQTLDLTHTLVRNLETLKKLTSLTTLYIERNLISDKQIEELQKALPNLMIVK